jgi:hypothetical protein
MEASGESHQNNSGPENPKESFEFPFSQNETLLELTDYVATVEPDWERMIHMYEALKSNVGKIDENSFPGQMLEIHLRALLHDFSRASGNLDLNPIADGYRTKDKFFEKHPGTGGMSVVNLSTLKHHNEKDAVFRAGDLLTVAEVKYTKKRNEMYRRGHKRGAVSDAIRPEMTNHDLRPYIDAFGFPIGYIVLTMPEAVSSESPLQQQFTDNGGLIVPFNTTYDDFGFRAYQAFSNRIAK